MYTDITERELLQKIETRTRQPQLFFFHSPLCGTCALARRMLDVVMGTLPTVHVYGCNINVMPNRAQTWQIQSVPCLLIVQNGEIIQRRYAFAGVAEMYSWLKPFAPSIQRGRKFRKTQHP